LVDAAALAAIALVGYLFGRRTASKNQSAGDDKLSGEIARAERIAEGLRRLDANLGVEITTYRRAVAEFERRLASIHTGGELADWPRLRQSADDLVAPTLKFATNLSLTAHQLRREQAQLAIFSGSRIDAATGLHNRRSLDEQLDAFLSLHALGKRRFSLALFSVSPAGEECDATGVNTCLQPVARLLEDCMRDDDFVARYSDDEFVVLMPQTATNGALAFAERLLVRSLAELDFPLAAGVVEATSDEPASKLLSRADSALYSARAAGGASLFLHTGSTVRRRAIDLQPPAAESATTAELVETGV
jgi:diguanylate cyclase (GGDEF)-like protein